MEQPSRRLFWIEAGLALTSAVASMLTLLWPDWIEIVFHVEPDQGSGALEWSIALAFVASTVLCAALARRERGRDRRTAA
jgi:hypothetical protein